jgi:uncharacterized protein
MEDADKELIRKAIPTDAQLRRLFHEHESIETTLSKYEHRRFLTPQEELELKDLKKRKLSGVDRMMELLAEHRAE